MARIRHGLLGFLVLALLGVGLSACLPLPPQNATQLNAGQGLTAGQQLQNGVFTLAMQSDGNLVDYVQEPDGQSYPAWDTGTAGHPGAYLIMQGDGNLVIYATNGTPLWNAGTWGHPGSNMTLWSNGALIVWASNGVPLWGSGAGPAAGSFPSSPASATALNAGQGLLDGQSLQAGSYQLVMQTDGNLVVYGPAGAVWDSGTVGQPGDSLIMQGDGNLVIYSAYGVPLWSSGTQGNPGASGHLLIQGSLVIENSQSIGLWDSDPAQYPPNTTGYDISWPQCGLTYPPGSTVAIVGINDGRADTTNPCVSSEAAWAGYQLDAYMNINSPGALDSNDSSGPAGNCSASDSSCMAYNYGYNAALYAVRTIQSLGYAPRMWWLDVEIVGSCGSFPTQWQTYWSCNQGLNDRTIQGALDGLHASGYQAGIYCTQYQWGQIAGTWVPNNASSVPNWLAGDDLSNPTSWCGGSADFLPSQPWLLQLWPASTWDEDIAC